MVPNGRGLDLRTPFDPGFVEWVKSVPGREWDKDRKVWSIPPHGMRDMVVWAARSGHRIVCTTDVQNAFLQSERRRRDLVHLKQAFDSDLGVPSATPLFPYQRADVKYLIEATRGAGGALNASDMGTGKTITALSTIVLTSAFPALVLCPAGLKYTWQRQAATHFPDLKTTVVDEDADLRPGQWGAPDVVIANYELLLRDVPPRLRQWNIVVADEARKLKSHRAKTSEAVKRLDRRASLALSGTPIENRLEELHSIMDFVQPGLLGAGWWFVKQHTLYDPKTGYPIGYKDIEIIRERIAPYYIRRTKKQVLPQLPGKLPPINVEISLSKTERAVYVAIRDQVESFIKENPRLDTNEIVVILLRLRQCVDGLALVGEGSESSKLDMLDDLLSEAGDRKVVVFSTFAEAVKLIHDRFGGHMLTGKSSPKEKERIITEFAGDSVQLLACTDALAFGHDLTMADIMVHYDQPWNPAIKEQREDRTYRIGQRNALTVVNFIARKTVDEYILRIIHRKLKVAQAVFDIGDIHGTRHLNRTDVLAVLRGED